MSVFLVVISSNLVRIQANKDVGCQKILWGKRENAKAMANL